MLYFLNKPKLFWSDSTGEILVTDLAEQANGIRSVTVVKNIMPDLINRLTSNLTPIFACLICSSPQYYPPARIVVRLQHLVFNISYPVSERYTYKYLFPGSKRYKCGPGDLEFKSKWNSEKVGGLFFIKRDITNEISSNIQFFRRYKAAGGKQSVNYFSYTTQVFSCSVSSWSIRKSTPGRSNG